MKRAVSGKTAYRLISGRSTHDIFGIDAYSRIAGTSWSTGLGEWLFSGPPLNREDSERDLEYLTWLKERELQQVVQAALGIRQHIPAFLEQCAQDVLAEKPDLVGFTTTFTQTVPSLALAVRLKKRDAGLLTILGGAHCDGPMGRALHKHYNFVDFVLSGEAERTFPALLDALERGEGFESIGGLYYRDQAGASNGGAADASNQVPMSDVPTPDYDEYFSRLAGLDLAREIGGEIQLPVETSRGCWWGQKHHCTFCGLNGSSMTFRSKEPAEVASQLLTLSARYRRTRFEAVDNILDMTYFTTVIPWLKTVRDSGWDISLFYETKANLGRHDLSLLSDAGIHRIQPGIESLSSPILRLMKKGVTAMQNIQLLKWAKELGIAVVWNLIFGFPGEEPSEYDRMAQLVPLLSHLDPPTLQPLCLERFSPYFDNSDAYGLNGVHPATWYRFVYNMDDALMHDLAYDFEYATTGRLPSEYVKPLAQSLDTCWNQFRTTPASSLTYRRGRGFLEVRDHRRGMRCRELTLTGLDAAVHLACDSASTIDQVLAVAVASCEAAPVSRAAVVAALNELIGQNLLYQEGERFLALATSESPLRGARALEHSIDLVGGAHSMSCRLNV